MSQGTELAEAPVLDVERIRADFPALAAGSAHFDSPGGTQTPRPVIEAIATTLAEPLANRGVETPAARNAELATREARGALGDLTSADPRGVVFGRSATELTMMMARTLARGWRPGDEVIVTRLDHDANIRPWVLAAERAGVRVRWADFEPTTGELAVDAVTGLITERTRLVAVSAASNLIGTRPDVPAIAARAHEAGALVYTDGVHYAAHALVDVTELGADFFVCSPYKFFGPHLGVLVADPALLESLRPDKLLPSSDAVPERFELGTLPYELLAGTTAAVDYLAGMVDGPGSRRQRLARSLAASEAHQRRLSVGLREGLRDRSAVLYGSGPHGSGPDGSGHSAPGAANPGGHRRTSTVLFDLPGLPASRVASELAGRDVNAPAGSFYAIEASRHLGLGDHGAVRAGLAPYSSAADVARLLAAVDDIFATVRR